MGGPEGIQKFGDLVGIARLERVVYFGIVAFMLRFPVLTFQSHYDLRYVVGDDYGGREKGGLVFTCYVR